MLLKWIDYDLDLTLALSIWFIVFVLHFKWNVGYYIRKVFKIKQTRSIKLLDCFPCQSFWVALITVFALTFTINPIIAMLVYLIAQTTDKK
jgi:hypothetical protein